MTKSKATRPYKATRNYDGKSAEARRLERRNQLIESCIERVGRDGHAAASLNAICADAGLTKRYFYESFDSVETLLCHAFRRISTELQQQVIAKIAGQTTPHTMVTAGFRAFFQYVKHNPERGRLFLIEALSVEAARKELLGNGGGHVPPFLLTTTLQFLDGDGLPQPILAVMAQGAVGAAIFVAQNWISTGYEQDIDDLVQGVSEICFGIGQRLNIDLDMPTPTKSH